MPGLYHYKITIRFSEENTTLEEKSHVDVLFSKHTHSTDSFDFRTKCMVKIDAYRDFDLVDTEKAIFGNGNSIHIQMLKAILLYGLTCKKCVNVKNITLTKKVVRSKYIHSYLSVENFKQPFPLRTHDIKPLPVDVMITKLAHTRRDYAYRIAMSYLLREQYSLHAYHKFECLWRAYNCLFRELTSTSGDNAGIKAMIEHIDQHRDKYTETINFANNLNLNDRMFKFRSFIEDKIEKSNKHCDKFKKFVEGFSKNEILAIFKQYRVQVENKIDVHPLILNKGNIKTQFNTYIDNTVEDVAKIDVEKFIFILWYAYYLRNMYFHAVIKEASFSLYSISRDNHMNSINNFMEIFLYEIFQDDTF